MTDHQAILASLEFRVLAADIVAWLGQHPAELPEPALVSARFTILGWSQTAVDQAMTSLWHTNQIEIDSVAWWADNQTTIEPTTRGRMTVVRLTTEPVAA